MTNTLRDMSQPSPGSLKTGFLFEYFSFDAILHNDLRKKIV